MEKPVFVENMAAQGKKEIAVSQKRTNRRAKRFPSKQTSFSMVTCITPTLDLLSDSDSTGLFPLHDLSTIRLRFQRLIRFARRDFILVNIAMMTFEFVLSREAVVSAVFASDYPARKLLRVGAVLIAGVA